MKRTTVYRYCRYILEAMALCLISLLSSAQGDLHFTQYTRQEGLSNTNINAITQDKMGYMWIGTEDGLNRFDGTNFIQFHSERNKESLPADQVLSLHWIDDEQLAVITREGLNIINTRTLQQASLIVPAGPLKYEARVNKMRGLLTDSEGNFYITTRTGFYHFDKQKKLVFRYDDYQLEELEKKGAAFGIFFGWLDAHSILVTGQDCMCLYDTRAKKITKIENYGGPFLLPKIIGPMANNYVLRQPWPGCFIVFPQNSDSVIYIDENKKTVTGSKIGLPLVSFDINWRSELFVMPDSSLFLSGRDAGLFKLWVDRKTGAIRQDAKELFANQQCNSMYIDRQSRYWFGMRNGLLMEKKDVMMTAFIHLPDSLTREAPGITVNEIDADDKYIYAACSSSGGLYAFNKADGSFARKTGLDFPPGSEKTLYSVKRWRNDSLLIGVPGYFYWYRVSTDSKGMLAVPGWKANRSWIASVFEDSRHNCWAFANHHDGCYLNRRGSNQFDYFLYPSLPKKGEDFFRMAEDSHGNLWMGGNGLARYSPQKNLFDYYLDSFPALRVDAKGVSALAIDKNDQVWIGNQNNGLILLQPFTQKHKVYTKAEGLPDNHVLALSVTGDLLWIACYTGIACMDLGSKKIINVVNSRALSYQNITGRRFFYDSVSSMMYIGAGADIVRFAVTPTIPATDPPDLVIESISLGSDSLLWNPPPVVYTSWSKKNVIVTFTAINYNDAADQRFAYRLLNGKESAWVSLNGQRQIVFSDFSSGRHAIEIETYSVSNLWPPKTTVLVIIVNPPFWETWWFYLLLASAIAAVIYAVVKYRIEQLKKVITVREKIAQDLHDEVGATLSGISMYSHLTKEQMKANQPAEVEKSLNVIQHSAAEMVDKLNDIVWIVNPHHDSLQKLLQKLEEYAGDMAVAGNIKVIVSITEKVVNVKLPMEARRNIYLICKEAINNAVKYSHASQLELVVAAFDHTIVFSIKDNGGGFDYASTRKGNGLNNMEKRAAEVGAALSIESKPGGGATIAIQYKITR